MKKKLSRKEFLKRFDLLWQSGPKVTFRNPDDWDSY